MGLIGPWECACDGELLPGGGVHVQYSKGGGSFFIAD